MNSVLLNSEDIIAEIKEMVKDMENLKSKIDMFEEIVKEKLSLSAT